MADVGRNDPCPCGSSKKYKHCCRAKDKAERLENRTTPPPGAASAQPVPAPSFTAPAQQEADQTEARTRSPAEEAWAAFNEMDYEAQLAFIDELIGDEDRMDEENAFELFNALYYESLERGERGRVTALMDRLAEAQPDVYEAEAQYLLDWQLHTAASEGRLEEVLRKHSDVLARLPARDIDVFDLLADLLAYYGHGDQLAACMTAAWSDVKNADILPRGIAEFSSLAVRYVLFQYFEEHGTVDLDDPALRERLDALDVERYTSVELFADALSGRMDGTWSMDDFAGDEVSRSTFTLSAAFTGYLFREHGVPCTKGDLAARTLDAYLGQRRNGELPVSENPPTHPLCPDRKSFWAFLSELDTFLGYKAHQAAAAVELTPHWITFVEAQGLADERCAAALPVLRHVVDHVQKPIREFSQDTRLPGAVKAAWEELEV